MKPPNRVPKLKLGLCFLAAMSFILVATSCVMSGRQVAEKALFRHGEVVKYEFKSGDQFSERVLTDEEVNQVKQLLRVDQRSWSQSFVTYVPKLRIKSGKSDVNITNKSIIINLADPDGSSSQYVAECDDDTHHRMIKLLGK